MDWFVENWTTIGTIIFSIIALIFIVIAFFKMPVAMQRDKIKEWLLWAVTECERQMGSGTGVLKLREVYDWFLSTFKWVSRFVSFETFSMWVDEALVKMREIIEQNNAIAEYVNGDEENENE